MRDLPIADLVALHAARACAQRNSILHAVELVEVGLLAVTLGLPRASGRLRALVALVVDAALQSLRFRAQGVAVRWVEGPVAAQAVDVATLCMQLAVAARAVRRSQ